LETYFFFIKLQEYFKGHIRGVVFAEFFKVYHLKNDGYDNFNLLFGHLKNIGDNSFDSKCIISMEVYTKILSFCVSCPWLFNTKPSINLKTTILDFKENILSYSLNHEYFFPFIKYQVFY